MDSTPTAPKKSQKDSNAVTGVLIRRRARVIGWTEHHHGTQHEHHHQHPSTRSTGKVIVLDLLLYEETLWPPTLHQTSQPVCHRWPKIWIEGSEDFVATLHLTILNPATSNAASKSSARSIVLFDNGQFSLPRRFDFPSTVGNYYASSQRTAINGRLVL